MADEATPAARDIEPAATRERGIVMVEGETELRMVLRHGHNGRRHIIRQQELIDQLEAKGQRTVEAKTLLATFEHTQRLHEAHLALLEAK
jgi:hypothetical protein